YRRCTLASFCNNVTLLTFLTTVSARPLQATLAPCPDKAFDQQEQENQDGNKCADRQPGKCDGERHEKNRLHVEDQKNDGVKIILRPELYVRFTNGFNAALVDRVFFRARFWRLEKSSPHPCQGQRDQWKDQRHANEDNNEQIRIWIHEVPVKFARKESLPSLYFRDVN